MKIQDARTLYVQAHRALLSHGISDFHGDYGEHVVRATIGGKLMPPTFKAFDIDHPEYGRVQVKTRTLLDRTQNRKNTETRAVVGKNRHFDYLAHLVLDRNLDVSCCILVSLAAIWDHLDNTNGKIKIEDTRASADAFDLTEPAKAAQKLLDER